MLFIKQYVFPTVFGVLWVSLQQIKPCTICTKTVMLISPHCTCFNSKRHYRDHNTLTVTFLEPEVLYIWYFLSIFQIYWSGIFVIFLIITALRSDENTRRKLFYDTHPLLWAFVFTCMSVNPRLDIPDFLPPLLNKRQHPPLKCQSLAQLASLSQVTKYDTNCIILYYYIFIHTYFLHSVWLLKLPVN